MLASGGLSLILGFVVKLILGWLADKRNAQALKDLGRAEGADETNAVISETADEQARINAIRRGTAADVAERLRLDAERERRGHGREGIGN